MRGGMGTQQDEVCAGTVRLYNGSFNDSAAFQYMTFTDK